MVIFLELIHRCSPSCSLILSLIALMLENFSQIYSIIIVLNIFIVGISKYTIPLLSGTLPSIFRIGRLPSCVNISINRFKLEYFSSCN